MSRCPRAHVWPDILFIQGEKQMKLTDKTAVVTGAGSGIGRAIAMRLAAEGARVLVMDIREEAAVSCAEEIRRTYHTDAFAFHGDVSRKEDNAAMILKAVEDFGRLDILVCNAGIVAKGRPIEDIPAEQWERFIGVNLMGPIFATQAAIPCLKKQRSGCIIYIASIAGEVGGVAAEATYAVTKSGVLCLTKSVAKQMAPFGVTVNAVAPGTIRTNMTDILQYDEKTLASIPLGRIGAAEDIAAAVLYLASEDAGYVTGTTLDVNGGLYMR